MLGIDYIYMYIHSLKRTTLKKHIVICITNGTIEKKKQKKTKSLHAMLKLIILTVHEQIVMLGLRSLNIVFFSFEMREFLLN